MCGICGFLAPAHEPDGDRGLQGMVAQLRHRGPDDAGIWPDPDAGLALGHTRLAILDLSPAGHQPMVSADGRWVISYNGEIYNAAELRADLKTRGCALRGHSDTEVLLEAIAAWGVERTLAPRQRHVRVGRSGTAASDGLTLARDRIGKKPLYYWRSGRQPPVRLRAQGAARAPGFRADDRS